MPHTLLLYNRLKRESRLCSAEISMWRTCRTTSLGRKKMKERRVLPKKNVRDLTQSSVRDLLTRFASFTPATGIIPGGRIGGTHERAMSDGALTTYWCLRNCGRRSKAHRYIRMCLVLTTVLSPLRWTCGHKRE